MQTASLFREAIDKEPRVYTRPEVVRLTEERRSWVMLRNAQIDEDYVPCFAPAVSLSPWCGG